MAVLQHNKKSLNMSDYILNTNPYIVRYAWEFLYVALNTTIAVELRPYTIKGTVHDCFLFSPATSNLSSAGLCDKPSTSGKHEHKPCGFFK